MTPQEPRSLKSFWSRPEGVVGWIFWGVAAALIIWFWGSVVGFLLSAALSTLHLMIVGGAITVIIWALTSKKVHYLGRSIARMITGWFVAIDPIGIRKTYIEQTEKKKAELDSAVQDIRGLRIKLQRRIETNQGAYEASMKQLHGATIAFNDPRSSEDRKRQAGRSMASESKHTDGLEVILSKQKAHMDRYDVIINVLARYEEVCDDAILDLKREVELQQQDQEESRGFHKGMRAAFGILKGSGDDQEMSDMATEQLATTYAQQMGEVEGLLDLTKDVISRADLNDEASLAAVKDKLDRWTNSNSGMQVGRQGSKQDIIAAASPSISIPAPVSEQLKISSKQ